MRYTDCINLTFVHICKLIGGRRLGECRLYRSCEQTMNKSTPKLKQTTLNFSVLERSSTKRKMDADDQKLKPCDAVEKRHRTDSAGFTPNLEGGSSVSKSDQLGKKSDSHANDVDNHKWQLSSAKEGNAKTESAVICEKTGDKKDASLKSVTKSYAAVVTAEHSRPSSSGLDSTRKTSQDYLGSSSRNDSTVPYTMSPILFESQDDDTDSKQAPKTMGCSLKELKKMPDCMETSSPLKPSESSTVTIRLPFTYKEGSLPIPHPTHFIDKWDNDHVRMPCSSHSEYPIQQHDGKTVLTNRWKLIEVTLRSPIPGPYELEEAILKYNHHYADKWEFAALCAYFQQVSGEERNRFFRETLPGMVKLALQLPHLCTSPIPLLKAGKSRSLTMSQQQIACLLANAFFCTFPRRNARVNSEYSNYPDINFSRLFQGDRSQMKMEKLKCIIHYFERVVKLKPTGLVTFSRQYLPQTLRWTEMGINLTKLHVSSEGTIEDNGKGLLQVDFANKYIGGGVLGHGCVQEEIRFLICPEMIITRLFTEVLGKNESVIMTGCEQFSKYTGYSNTFQWLADHVDTTERDTWGRLCCKVVAIDALVIHEWGKQFSDKCVVRELNKAYAGFWSSKSPNKNPAVCTGNWGCGAFGGDKHLKALIQLLAAACAQRDVCYFTFGDTQLVEDLASIHTYLTEENQLAVGNIVQLIGQYYHNVASKHSRTRPRRNLFEYIIAVFEGTLDEEFSGDSNSGSSLEMKRPASEEETSGPDTPVLVASESPPAVGAESQESHYTTSPEQPSAESLEASSVRSLESDYSTPAESRSLELAGSLPAESQKATIVSDFPEPDSLAESGNSP